MKVERHLGEEHVYIRNTILLKTVDILTKSEINLTWLLYLNV